MKAVGQLIDWDAELDSGPFEDVYKAVGDMLPDGLRRSAEKAIGTQDSTFRNLFHGVIRDIVEKDKQ